jgi:3-dehydroquinate dehydratase-1
MKTVKIGNVLVGKKPVLLCSVIEEDVQSTLLGVKGAMNAGADCIELRIDKLKNNVMVKEAVQKVQAPALVVCRPLHLDGFFKGSEDERIKRLLIGLESGANAIDIELTTPPQLRKKVIDAVKVKSVPLVICYENFEKTPSKEELLRILKEERSLGADIAKFAVKANSHEDLLIVLSVVLEAKKVLTIPFVAIAMGKFGSPSRPLGCVLGSSMTYCARAPGKEGAPGQLPVKETREIINLFSQIP